MDLPSLLTPCLGVLSVGGVWPSSSPFRAVIGCTHDKALWSVPFIPPTVSALLHSSCVVSHLFCLSVLPHAVVPRRLSPHVQPRYPTVELHMLPGVHRRRLPLALRSVNALPSAFPPRPQRRVGILGPSHLLPAADGGIPRPGCLRDFLFCKLSDSP